MTGLRTEAQMTKQLTRGSWELKVEIIITLEIMTVAKQTAAMHLFGGWASEERMF